MEGEHGQTTAARVNGTHQLNGSHVFLPPQEFLEAWSSSSKAIVEVHDDVDRAVHHSMERTHSTWNLENKILDQTLKILAKDL